MKSVLNQYIRAITSSIDSESTTPIFAMSDVPDTSYLSRLGTPSGLHYLLGELASQWQELGKQLNISEAKLREIHNYVRANDRRMKEMFYCWLMSGGEACNWFAIQRALIGEKDLAENLTQYLLQLPMQPTGEHQAQLSPFEHFYEEKPTYFEANRLARRLKTLSVL